MTLTHPAIQCVADHEGSALYEMPDGQLVRAYSEQDAKEWYATRPKPITEPQPELPIE